jgi:Uncharacterized protein conserved in bacteria (DUF2242)
MWWSSPSGRTPGLAAVALLSLTLLGLAGCQTLSNKPPVYLGEAFEKSETFSRLFDADPQSTCGAARRALLSQGYLLRDRATSDNVVGQKNFQPSADSHVQLEIHVACQSEMPNGQVTTAYVIALQERYALRKTPNSASVGVNAIGSLSLPLGSSEDSLVKVSSETVPAGAFYDRFFALMERLLREQPAAAP